MDVLSAALVGAVAVPPEAGTPVDDDENGREPPYPVVNAQPTIMKVIANFQLGDYGRLIFGSALGAAWGFAAGTQHPPPSPLEIIAPAIV